RNGRVKSERHERAIEIVVDGLGDADHAQAAHRQLARDRERAVAADADERVQAGGVEALDYFISAIPFDYRAIRLAHRIAGRIAPAGGAADGPAERGDPADRVAWQTDESAVRKCRGLEKAVEAVANADAFPAASRRREHGGANHGIESRRVAAAGVDRD